MHADLVFEARGFGCAGLLDLGVEFELGDLGCGTLDASDSERGRRGLGLSSHS